MPKEFCGGDLQFEDLASIYAGAEIVLGIQLANSSRTQTSRRLFETLACGAFHLALDTKGTRKCFVSGKHLVLTKSAEETLESAKYYLNNPRERKRIAAAGQFEVYRCHTYPHRAMDFEAAVRGL